MATEWVAYIHNGILFMYRDVRLNSDICSKRDGNRGHSVAWNRPDMERQIPHVLFHIWKLKKKGWSELRRVITRGS